MLASQVLAAGFQANGISGVMLVLALICFLIAAIAAWFAPGHKAAIVLIAAGGFFAVLAQLVTG
jgi:hypothetical protein